LLHKNRVFGLYFVFAAAFLALLARLFYIQVIDGPEYTRQAVAQRQRTLDYVQYPRGQILDRYFRPLTNNERQPCCVVFPIMVEDFPQTAEFLSAVFKISLETVTNKLGTPGQVVKNPFILKANLKQEEILAVQDCGLPGIFVLPMVPRYRPDSLMAHFIGFVSGISKEEYSRFQQENRDYQPTDAVGKSGLELRYETYLKGGHSRQVAALIDDKGRLIQGKGFSLLPLPEESNYSLANLVLTIDRDYQQIAERALQGHNGAVVVMDVTNGDILAAASSPSFDPYLLEKPSSDDAYVNKVLQPYPPASVFKILIAAAALEEGLVRPEDIFECTGQITIPSGRQVSCWKPDGHGTINFAQAMAYSCNPVFVEIGLKLGGKRIKNYIDFLGIDEDKIIGYDLEEKTHVDFNSSVPGDLANVSIGENGIRLSPVQVAKLISIAANGGFRVNPRLVAEIRDDKGNTLKEFSSPAPVQVITSQTAQILKSMLIGAVAAGTGTAAGVPGLSPGGKTGSSQTHGVWFAGFAPGEKPRWAVVVFLKKGSSGGKEAAPIFREVVESLAVLEKLNGDN